MKVKAILDGHDGINHYDPGDTISANAEHCKMLLVNGAAEPIDSEAKKFCEDLDDPESHDLYVGVIAVNAENAKHEETVKPRRRAAKAKRKAK